MLWIFCGYPLWDSPFVFILPRHDVIILVLVNLKDAETETKVETEQGRGFASTDLLLKCPK